MFVYYSGPYDFTFVNEIVKCFTDQSAGSQRLIIQFFKNHLKYVRASQADTFQFHYERLDLDCNRFFPKMSIGICNFVKMSQYVLILSVHELIMNCLPNHGKVHGLKVARQPSLSQILGSWYICNLFYFCTILFICKYVPEKYVLILYYLQKGRVAQT